MKKSIMVTALAVGMCLSATVVGAPVAFKANAASSLVANKNVVVAANVDVAMRMDDFIVGVLSFKQTARGKISVKYSGTESKTFSATGSWSSFDENGTATALLKAKGGAEVALSLDAAGNLAAEAKVPSAYTLFAEGSNVSVQSGTAAVGATAKERASFKGYYTVALPISSVTWTGVLGTGYITLNFTSAAAVKSGKVSYSGVMPNGKKFSGTGYLSVSGGTASLAVFKRASYDVYGAELKIGANASKGLKSPETSRAVTGEGIHIHNESGLSYVNLAEAYGSWYPAKKSPSEICSSFGIDKRYGLRIGGKLVGSVEADSKGLKLVDADKSVRLTFNKASGAIGGKAALALPDGSKISGTIAGVLNPGWGDCGCGDGYTVLPLGEGSFTYDGTVGKKRMKHSVPVTLVPLKVAAASRLDDVDDDSVWTIDELEWPDYIGEEVPVDEIGALFYAEGDEEGVAPDLPQIEGNRFLSALLGLNY